MGADHMTSQRSASLWTWPTCEVTHLMARYMGRMAKRGKVCTLIIMVMKAMYSSTLMKPGEVEAPLKM